MKLVFNNSEFQSLLDKSTNIKIFLEDEISTFHKNYSIEILVEKMWEDFDKKWNRWMYFHLTRNSSFNYQKKKLGAILTDYCPTFSFWPVEDYIYRKYASASYKKFKKQRERLEGISKIISLIKKAIKNNASEIILTEKEIKAIEG